jgi:5-methylcytosine-specific restriction endonuclease McrA
MTNGPTCGLCGHPASSNRLTFRYVIPDSESVKYRGADALSMDLPLCQPCGARALKHLKRAFAMKHFHLAPREGSGLTIPE